MKCIIFTVLALAIFYLYAQVPRDFWGMHAFGITDNISASEDEKVLYLTLDACEGKLDRKLINFLRAKNIPATLFINARWINANPKAFQELAADSLFRIENHGTKHKPASVKGKYAYDIKGTVSRENLLAEINDNADKIEKLIGVRPSWYRSGTAHYDAEAIEIITKDMGLKIAGFAVNLDGGATFSANQIYKASLEAQPGDIMIAHTNHPDSETYNGLARAIPELIKRGFVFRLLP